MPQMMKRQPYRIQTLLGVTLLLAAAYIALPLPHADIVVLFEWAHLSAAIWMWPVVSALLGLGLLAHREPRWLMSLCMLSTVLLFTFTSAMLLSVGASLGAVVMAWLTYQALALAVAFKSEVRK